MAVLITDDEMVERLLEISSIKGDAEVTHILADEELVKLLRTLGYNKTADVYQKMEKWYA